jgi:hypothetical protein
MGTDIHLFVEHALGVASRAEFISLTDGSFSLTRDYRFFGALSEVRGGAPLVPSRGVPEDASDETCRCYYHLICEDEDHDGLWQHITELNADALVKRGVSHRRSRGGLSLVSNPDAHHPSWLTRAELLASLAHAGLKPEDLAVDTQATLGAIHTIPEANTPRIVFWFDN